MSDPTAETERCLPRLDANRTAAIDTQQDHRTQLDRENPPDWGDSLGPKADGICRILLQNPGGLGQSADNFKMSALKEAVVTHQPDVLCLAETNVNWTKCPTRDSLWARTRGWTSTRRLRTDHNKRDPTAPRHLVGGTALLAVDKIAHRHVESGGDPRKLGRWSWMRFKGSGNIHTRVVSAYVPCSATFKGTWSAYDQQVRGLCLDGLTGRCPRAQFWVDLEQEISQWQQQGDRLILAGDWNTDVRGIQLFEEYGLREVITSKHDSEAPGTHNRGSVPIDGIFCSDSLPIHRGGYLGFQDICGDHRALWIDIPIEVIIGFRMPSVVIPAARRLKTEDPKVETKYLNELHAFYKRFDLYNRIATVHANTVFPLPPAIVEEYECIDRLRTRGMLTAERKCRHLHHGATPWSPAFAEARDRVKFWLIQQRRAQGYKINTRGMLRIGRRLNIPDYLPTVNEITRELRIARKKYRDAKEKGRSNRNTFLESLALTKSNHDDEKAATLLTQLLAREDQREASRRVKFITGKFSNTSCSYVEVAEPDGTTSQINSQRNLESAIIRENVRKYSQAHQCPLLHGHLRQEIGFLGDGPAVDAILKGTYDVPDDTPLATKEFLAAMAAPPGSEFSEAPYTLEDYRTSWRKARESTSSG